MVRGLRLPQGLLSRFEVFVLAEQEGFEPSIRHNRIPDFESGAFDHSAIAPVFESSILSQGRRTADAGVGAVPVGLMVM